jgi:hypothetical protein
MLCHIVIQDPKPPTTPEPDAERKERVIHTRVPESLEAELREQATRLGISVSNLVRNVLGNAFGLVNDVAADLDAIARGAYKAKPKPAPAAPPVAEPPPDFADVLAWQSMVLGKNAVCAKCNELLPRGSNAALGVPEHGGGRVVICTACLDGVRA